MAELLTKCVSSSIERDTEMLSVLYQVQAYSTKTAYKAFPLVLELQIPASNQLHIFTFIATKYCHILIYDCVLEFDLCFTLLVVL